MGAGLDYMHSRGIVDAAIIAAVGPTLDEGRVWLPWRNEQNEQVYSSGRAINGGEPKYKNQVGPKPPLFATPAAWQSPEVVLVEGQFDALAAAQAGTPAFATTTSSLSDEAVPILAAKKRIILVPDNDEAGIKWKDNIVLKLAHLVDLYEARVPQPFKDLAEVAERAAGDPGEAVFDVLEAKSSLHATPFIDFDELWRNDNPESEWLIESVLARGRGHSIYAEWKAGKSLFVFYQVVRLAIAKEAVVVYLDYEMSEDDLRERLQEMGYGPETDLEMLKYALLPSFPPLNTADGAAVLFLWVDRLRERWPDKHMVVVIDTISRAAPGKEESSEPIQEFYRHTGIGLKQRQITWVRLDHAGKDVKRGARGSSTKGEDVDIIWNLSRTDQGTSLKRDGARMSWVPQEVFFDYSADPTRFTEVEQSWPAGTHDLAKRLDELEVDLSLSVPKVRKVLKSEEIKASNHLLGKAMKYRRMMAAAHAERFA